MKGKYASITPTFSKQLRDLISSMLALKPQNRPTIIDVINKPFIRKRIEKYLTDMMNRNDTGPQDTDEVFLDTIRQQAQCLEIALAN